jgi:tetratricopeptide (TPR) repeat protein
VRPVLLSFALLLTAYLGVIGPFTNYMAEKPMVEKLGYPPQPTVLRAISADQGPTAAAWLVMKVLFYYGDLVEAAQQEVYLSPDYVAIHRNLETAVQLDPYNMDAYYFAQAILVWDAGRADAVNEMLEHGMAYRTWDWYLPFFAGFNSAYFLKDYEKAAEYYKRAAELSGAPLFSQLAGRYLQEVGKTDLAIAYLTMLEKSARNEAVKNSFQIRIRAFREVKRIEVARDRYRKEKGVLPESVGILHQQGFLDTLPSDPYGGTFYLDGQGQVRSTSKFAFGSDKQKQ